MISFCQFNHCNFKVNPIIFRHIQDKWLSWYGRTLLSSRSIDYMNPLAKRKISIHDAMLLKCISWNSHNKISATYVQYAFENAKFRCGHAKQWRWTTTSLATLLPYKVPQLISTRKNKYRYPSPLTAQKWIKVQNEWGYIKGFHT